MAVLDRWYEAQGAYTSGFFDPPAGPRVSRSRRAGEESRLPAAAALRVVLIVGVVIALAGWRVQGTAQWHDLTRPFRGTPPAATAYQPLPKPPVGQGGYAFLKTQRESADPVTYDPCTVIHVAVNHRGAPTDGDLMATEAVAQVVRATGLHLVVDAGDSSLPLVPDWTSSPGALDQTPPRILVGWATSDEVAGLAGKVAGLGGSSASASPLTGRWSWSTGQVALDTDYFATLNARGLEGHASGRAVIMHELGHVVGLAHVDDAHQLMAAENLGQVSFGDGDLRGLYQLGQGRCERGSLDDPWDPAAA